MVQGCGRPADVKNIKTLFKPLAPPDKANQSLPVSAALRAASAAAGGRR